LSLLKWKKTYEAFLWKKDQQNHTILKKMPSLTRLMKDVPFGGTLYIRSNECWIGMLKSAPKALILSTCSYHYDVDLEFFFKFFWTVEKKIWGCEVMAQSTFSIFKKLYTWSLLN